jgi:AraC-like DNA-binding protein
VVQVTLAGEGRYSEGGREWRLTPGMAFFACVPSEHVYWMPRHAPQPWTFYWMVVEHPYVTQRLRSLNDQRGAVRELTAEEHAATENLFRLACSGGLDEVEQEQAILNWWLELERANRRRSATPAQELLREVRDYARANLQRSFGVEQLASHRGMSRSHFTHHFRRLTGRTPAAVVLEVRMSEVLQRLADSRMTLAEIAVATGFGDATQLSKVFKRVRGITPGQFRRSRQG